MIVNYGLKPNSFCASSIIGESTKSHGGNFLAFVWLSLISSNERYIPTKYTGENGHAAAGNFFSNREKPHGFMQDGERLTAAPRARSAHSYTRSPGNTNQAAKFAHGSSTIKFRVRAAIDAGTDARINRDAAGAALDHEVDGDEALQEWHRKLYAAIWSAMIGT